MLDDTQPAAAVLDPAEGAVRQLVSWSELPPPPSGESMSARVDDQALWVQGTAAGPLLRVPVDGGRTAVWTHGLALAAAGRSSAWCTSAPPPQEVVHGAGAVPVGWGGAGSVLRADADGRAQRVHTDRPVRGLRTGADALWVQLDVELWSLRELGADTFEAVWSSRWVALPWVGDLPEQVSAADGQEEAPAGSVLDFAGDGAWHGYAYDPDSSAERGAAVRAGGWTWRAGWSRIEREGPNARRTAVAAAFEVSGRARPGDPPRCLVDLGEGTVLAAAPAGERLAIVLASDRQPSRVLVVDAVTRSAQTWLSGGELDISSGSWPLHPRPLEADSYTQQVLEDWSRLERYWRGPGTVEPLADGMSATRARLVGQWPATRLECTFDFEPCPGVRLRRSVALFDELGAIARPEHAQIHLMEDLDTRKLLPLEEAVDGVLDI
ncbi:hypothetical protein [Kineococcus sp. SYSU DK005]|uniref:hypothetical protein n=1 Tax=Kineococcus sp. SYSU DK005 TaxID=3383126 RepID=UPI003D7EE34B